MYAGLRGRRAETVSLFDGMTTGANYMVLSFQWGNLNHAQAMQSIRPIRERLMPRYGLADPSVSLLQQGRLGRPHSRGKQRLVYRSPAAPG